MRSVRSTPPFATAVTGPAAEFADQQAAIGVPPAPRDVLLCALTFGVLWLMTGSVVLPVKAVVMNALTVGAALAPLVLIYQGGRLEGVLGYTSNGGVEPTDFLVTAALVFALSTDYGVFLLGRIKEARDGGWASARPSPWGSPHRPGGHRCRDPARGRHRRVLHELDPVHPADRDRRARPASCSTRSSCARCWSHR